MSPLMGPHSHPTKVRVHPLAAITAHLSRRYFQAGAIPGALLVGPLGGYGAAAACVVCEAALLIVYYRAVHGTATTLPTDLPHQDKVTR